MISESTDELTPELPRITRLPSQRYYYRNAASVPSQYVHEIQIMKEMTF